MKFLSCNIRYSGAQDGPNNWPLRRELCAEVIKRQKAEVICFQEMSREQYIYLREALPEYDAYGIIDEPLGMNPVNSIFWLRERLTALSCSGYWLSETPQICGSKSWGSRCIRLANWAILLDKKSGYQFRVIATHLDHISQQAREEQAKMIVAESDSMPDLPQVLLGDMNSAPDNPAMAIFRQGGWTDTYESVHGLLNPGRSFHHFQGEAFVEEPDKIDYIYCRGRLYPQTATLIKDNDEGRYPSDHYFLSADLGLPEHP